MYELSDVVCKQLCSNNNVRKCTFKCALYVNKATAQPLAEISPSEKSNKTPYIAKHATIVQSDPIQMKRL